MLQLYDTSTDGYVPPFRYYIPEQSRWLTPDLLGGDITNPQSLNRYAYVTNNPTRFTDPRGLCPQPPRGDLAYTPDCKHLHQIQCTNMNCADQHYGGLMFSGATDVNQAICMSHGVLSYCGGDLFASLNIAGNDIFDAIMQGNGLSFTPPGMLQINSSGRASTGTGSFSFDPGAWMQAEGFVDSKILGQYTPVTGYGTINIFGGTQSAAFGTFAESLGPVPGTNFLATIYSTSALSGFNLNGSLNSFLWLGNVTASVSGGQVTIYTTNPNTGATGTWSFPAP